MTNKKTKRPASKPNAARALRMEIAERRLAERRSAEGAPGKPAATSPSRVDRRAMWARVWGRINAEARTAERPQDATTTATSAAPASSERVRAAFKRGVKNPIGGSRG